MAKKRIKVTDVNYNQEHLIDIDENNIPSPSGDIDPEKLVEVLQGSETIVVDLAEDNEHVEVHLDADVVAKIDNSMQLPVAPPVSTALVGVEHSGSQTMIGVGAGLKIENNLIKLAGGVFSVTSDQVEETIDIQDGDEYVLHSTNDNGSTLFNLPSECYLVISTNARHVLSAESHFDGTSITLEDSSDGAFIKRIGNMIFVTEPYEL